MQIPLPNSPISDQAEITSDPRAEEGRVWVLGNGSSEKEEGMGQARAVGKLQRNCETLTLKRPGDYRAPAWQVFLSRNLSLRRKWSQGQRAKERQRQERSAQLPSHPHPCHSASLAQCFPLRTSPPTPPTFSPQTYGPLCSAPSLSWNMTFRTLEIWLELE